MVLTIRESHLQNIRTHAESTYPNECCGILLGKLQGNVKTLFEVLPTENSWDEEAAAAFKDIPGSAQLSSTKRERFSIAPRTLLNVQKDARDRQLDIIGIYHSHPDHPAVPSEFDRAIAWFQYSYIIVSVQNGTARDLKNWSLDDDHQFQPEKMTIVTST
ncbi:MAG: M67 family metallopeptidase [Kastovskya adunca ATA6-11-RM4]|jgi:proteasome lid subunit RPN8/RPN11|nr:M67 family metallopeptidase [Kastovskya adunca ATA6-11-RM4]